MVRTFGLTHIAIAVRDVEKSARVSKRVLGAVETYRGVFVQLQTPGSRDVLVLEEGKTFALDPDGYEVEIWSALPTSVDPKDS